MDTEKTWPIRDIDVPKYLEIAEYCVQLVDNWFDGEDIPHKVLIVLEEIQKSVQKIEAIINAQMPSPEEQERFFTTPPEVWEAIAEEFKEAGLCYGYHREFCGDIGLMCKLGWKRAVTVRQVLYGVWLIEGAEYLREVRYSKYPEQVPASEAKESCHEKNQKNTDHSGHQGWLSLWFKQACSQARKWWY